MPPKQNSEPINLSIRTNAIKDASILSCFHDNIDDATYVKIIEYLKCGVQLYLEELKKILQDKPYEMDLNGGIDSFIRILKDNLSREFINSESILLKLFGHLIKNENLDVAYKPQLINFFKHLKLALELDIKHDHGGTRGHSVGKECVQFIIDNGTLQLELKGITPLDIIKNKDGAKLLSSDEGTCLSLSHEDMKFPPKYKILDTKSKKCVKEYLIKTQTIKCLPTIIDSAGQSDNVGEPPDFDILIELIVQNFGEFLFSRMFKSLVEDNIYLFTFLPEQPHSRDVWLKNTKSYIMRVLLKHKSGCYIEELSKDIIVNTGQTSQFSVPKITMFNSRTLLQYLKSPESIYRTDKMGNIWSALCSRWDPNSSFPPSVNEKHVNNNTDTRKKAEVLVRDLQYVKKICGDGCQNFATLVYSNLKTFFKHNGTNWDFYSDKKGYYKNITTETFDTFSAVVSSVLDSSYSIGTTSIKFQYTLLGDAYARFYEKSYIEVWKLLSNSYPLLLFTVAATAVAATAVAATVGGGGKNNNIKYNYYSESSDYSDDDDTIASNEFYNKLLLNYKNIKGGMVSGDEGGGVDVDMSMVTDKKETLKKEICLLGLNYKEVYDLHKDFWIDLDKSKGSQECCLIYLVQFIFTRINVSEKLGNFLTDIPDLSSSLNKIARLSEQIRSFKKQAEISNLMLKRAAEVINYDTSQLKKKITDDLELNEINSKLKELLLGNGVSVEGFFDVVEDICKRNECFSKKDIKECNKELIKTKNDHMTELSEQITTITQNLEGNDLLKKCLDVLKINDSGYNKYKVLFNTWNDLVENLKEFLVSISNKGRLFSVEDSVSNKMLVLIQFLFPFIYDESNNGTLSIMLPKQYSKECVKKIDDMGSDVDLDSDDMDDKSVDKSVEESVEESAGESCILKCYYDEITISNAGKKVFNKKSPFHNVANDLAEKSNIEKFSTNRTLDKYVKIHNCILLFSYCNLIYRLCPISLLEKAILKQFTIFDEDEMNKVDKSRTIDVLELIRITLKTWYETDIGDDRIYILDSLEQNPSQSPIELFKLFHCKNIGVQSVYKYPDVDLSSKEEHITLMQQYCNKYSLSLKKAFELIEFLLNGKKKLKELITKLNDETNLQSQLQLYFNNDDLNLISRSIDNDKNILLILLQKQKKVIFDFISKILPMSKSRDTEEDEKKYKSEIDFANAINTFESLNKERLKDISELIKALENEYKGLEKEKEELIKTLEELKEQRTKFRKEEKPIEDIVKNIKEKDGELKQNKEDLKQKKIKYDEEKSKYEYAVLLLFIEDGNNSDYMKYVKRIFEISEYEDYDKFKDLLDSNKELFKTKYQEFKVRLGLYYELLNNPEFKKTDKDADIERHVKRILGNAINFRLMSLSEKQKLKRDFCDKEDVNSGTSDSLEDFDLKDDEQETVKKLIKLLSNQLLTFKGLRTASEYRDKLNKNIKEKKELDKLKKKTEEKYPILEYVVLLNNETNEYYINQKLADYLSVKEEELKTLLRNLELYEKCEMLENKLKDEKKGEDETKEEEDDGEEEEEEEGEAAE